jgi:hypothetical protein
MNVYEFVLNNGEVIIGTYNDLASSGYWIFDIKTKQIVIEECV